MVSERRCSWIFGRLFLVALFVRHTDKCEKQSAQILYHDDPQAFHVFGPKIVAIQHSTVEGINEWDAGLETFLKPWAIHRLSR
jgi:hypothetical protein